MQNLIPLHLSANMTEEMQQKNKKKMAEINGKQQYMCFGGYYHIDLG
jgi:hypothetical protein